MIRLLRVKIRQKRALQNVQAAMRTRGRCGADFIVL
tara:strand:+ start:120 stop:227 length:108 start_codon:yes stop_codon:yes gene_type:complete